LIAAGTHQPKVLVLLASYNGGEWITPQIQSILAQQCVDVQILVRDDASTDDTRSRIAAFPDGAPVRLICGQTPTGSAAQNYFTLIRQCEADDFDFVALSDQDDVWLPDKLCRACQQLQLPATRSAGYSSATLAVWHDGRSALLTQPTTETTSDFLFGGIGQGCTFVLTKDFYRRARSFLVQNPELTRTIHYHDWALYALARTWRLGWTFDLQPSVRYRQHEQNDTGARSGLAGRRKRFNLIKRGWYADQLKAIAVLCARADQSNVTVAVWNSMLFGMKSWSRRLRIARFCLAGGRRRAADKAMLMLAALLGWI
jgi:rhamnosyltransferase